MVCRNRKYYEDYEQMSKMLLVRVKLALRTPSLSHKGVWPVTVKDTTVEENLWADPGSV